MRRLTITIPDETAEAVEFSSGVIAGWWQGAERMHLWINLAAVREQHPDAVIEWIDEVDQ